MRDESTGISSHAEGFCRLKRWSASFLVVFMVVGMAGAVLSFVHEFSNAGGLAAIGLALFGATFAGAISSWLLIRDVSTIVRILATLSFVLALILIVGPGVAEIDAAIGARNSSLLGVGITVAAIAGYLHDGTRRTLAYGVLFLALGVYVVTLVSEDAGVTLLNKLGDLGLRSFMLSILFVVWDRFQGQHGR